MTDKEFLELLMLYKAGKVPLMDVGLALARNQFTHEYIALANNILIAQKERGRVVRPQTISRGEKEMAFRLGAEGVQVKHLKRLAGDGSF